jgi:hypothetical protein
MKTTLRPYFSRPRTLALVFAIASCLVLYTILNNFHSIPDQIVHAGSVCTPPPSGMTAWWHGENDAIDSIGGNNGTLQNGATFAPGFIGQAFSFNSNFQYVSVPQSGSISLTTGITVEGWVKVNEMPPPNAWSVVNKDNPDSGPFDMRITNDGRAWFGVYVDTVSSWQGLYSPPGMFTAGNFFHIAGTYS